MKPYPENKPDKDGIDYFVTAVYPNGTRRVIVAHFFDDNWWWSEAEMEGGCSPIGLYENDLVKVIAFEEIDYPEPYQGESDHFPDVTKMV